jgi:hypothetical protein
MISLGNLKLFTTIFVEGLIYNDGNILFNVNYKKHLSLKKLTKNKVNKYS